MSNFDGEWDTVSQTPMGEQKAVLTIKSDGDSFTGSMDGVNGTMIVEDGKIDGNTLTWNMNMTSPFPMKLEASVTVDGDTFEGVVKAGAFGESPVQGTRKS